jgi:outer membrane lipoprotein SlyB
MSAGRKFNMKLIKISPMIVAALMMTAIAPNKASAGDISPAAGILIGAGAGGFIGSTIGEGRGQVVATAVGALIGAGIGYEMTKEYPDRRNHRPRRVVRYKKVYKDDYSNRKRHQKNRYRHKHDDVWLCNRSGRKCRLVM